MDPRVLPHLRPARHALAGVVGGQVVSGGLVVAQAFALAALVLAIVHGSAWTGAAVTVLVVGVLRAAVSWLVDVAAAHAAAQVGTTLRRAVLRRALDLDARALAEHRSGELATLATRGVSDIEPYLTRYLPALVVAAVLPPLTVVAVATQDLLAAAVLVATLPLVPLFAALIGISTRERAEQQWAALAQLSGHFVDVVRGLPTLVAFRRAGAQSPRIREITDRYRRANAAVLRLAFASSAALELVATISVALVAVLTGLRLAGGHVGLHTALVVLLLAPEAYWPLRRVGAEFHAAAEGTATFEAVAALMDTPLPRHGCAQPPSGPAALRLRGVELTWPGRTLPTVGPLDAVVPATGLSVLIGPSGCGKSTLLAAVLGELPPSAGRIEVGRVGLRDLDPVTWRGRVAYVGQRPWVVDGTVAENVRLGRPEATAAEVRDALDACGLSSISADLVLGEEGSGLSAGQRARLALARVAVSDRPFVLLDEASAHLDRDTEQVLLSVVRRLAQKRCVLAVAHGDAWTTAADLVISLPAPAPAEASPLRAGGRPGRRGLDTQGRRGVAASEPTTPTRPRSRLAAATALGVLAATAGVALTATAGWLITRASEHPPVLVLMVAIVGVRTFGLARPVLRYAERLLSHDVALRLLAQRRAQVFDLVVPLVPARLGRRRGDLLASLVDDVDALLDEQLRVRMPMLVWLGTTALTGLSLLAFEPVVAAVVAVGSLVVGALAYGCAHYGARHAAPAVVAARADVSRRTLAVLTDARALAQWQADAVALESVGEADGRRVRATTGSARWSALARALPLAAAGAGVVGVAPLVTGGQVGAPVAALLVLVPLALAEVVAPVADAGSLRVSTRAAARRIDELAEMVPALVDPASPLPATVGDRIALEEVTAAWTAGSTAVGPFSLALSPGRSVGIVGPSGCGKSTLAAVLARFLAPASGEYRVDGLPVGLLRADDVRCVVGLLDDDPYLFSSSVMENVRIARPGASDDEVESALRAAHLAPWLDGLPAGSDTRIGDGAMSVSGGERARIGIARLLLADLPVLVLDEPTAHLDAATARVVADELLRHAEDRAVLWITHDDTALDRMDSVLMLVERGAQEAWSRVG